MDSWGNDRLGFYQDEILVAVASVLIQPLPSGFFYDLYPLWTYYGLSR